MSLDSDFISRFERIVADYEHARQKLHAGVYPYPYRGSWAPQVAHVHSYRPPEPPQTVPVNSPLQTLHVDSPPQTLHVDSPPQTLHVDSPPQIVHVDSYRPPEPPQITQVHLYQPPRAPLPNGLEGLQLISGGSKPDSEDESHETNCNAETLAQKYLAAGSSIRCSLLHVKYGKYKGKAAGIIVFQTVFDFPAEDSRTKCATIQVSFSRGGPQAEEPTPLPKVLHHFPQLAQSTKITSVSIRRTLDVNGKVNTPSPADILEVGLSGSKEESFTRNYYSKITSKVMPHSDTPKGRQCINTVIWRLSEDKTQKGGVFPIFRGAVIVQLPDPDRPFYAQFTLKSTQACEVRQLAKFFISSFGRVEDGPVCFDSRFGFQADGLSNKLEDIKLDRLLALPEIQKLPDGL